MPSLATIIDKVSLAQVAQTASSVSQLAKRSDGATDSPQDDNAGTRASISARGRELSAGDQRRIAELKRIDAEVRAHEQAHINAGRGVVTSGPNYDFTYGPDGKQYAVSGEVGIDTAPERKPQANIDKGQRIQDAALAPARPSSQDYSVAAAGGQLEQQGRSDLAEDLREEAAARAQEAEAQRQAQLEAQTQQQEAAAGDNENTGALSPPTRTVETATTPTVAQLDAQAAEKQQSDKQQAQAQATRSSEQAAQAYKESTQASNGVSVFA